MKGSEEPKGPGLGSYEPVAKKIKNQHFSVAFKLLIIILAISVIPLIIVSISGMYSVHTISAIATDTGEEIARSSVTDSGAAFEAELIRTIRLQTVSLGETIDQNLHQVAADTTKLRDYTEFLYAHPDGYGRYPYPSTYGYAQNGVFGSVEPNNNSWLMVSERGLNPDHSVPPEVRDEIYLTEWTDVMFRTIAQNNPSAVQLYLNTRSHFSRGMPFVNGSFTWVDATNQFEPDMNLSAFDFYYLADETHDPE